MCALCNYKMKFRGDEAFVCSTVHDINNSAPLSVCYKFRTVLPHQHDDPDVAPDVSLLLDFWYCLLMECIIECHENIILGQDHYWIVGHRFTKRGLWRHRDTFVPFYTKIRKESSSGLSWLMGWYRPACPVLRVTGVPRYGTLRLYADRYGCPFGSD